jgi:hypothetical protein
MLEHTRQSIHFGVGCVFTPQPVFDAVHALQFQQELAKEGLTFTSSNTPPGAIILGRTAPPLEIRVQQPGPPVGQLAVVAAWPQRTLDDFADEARMVVTAFGATWPGQLQVIGRDVTIRYLYDVAGEHAFKYLWEERLHRREEELSAFGRSVLGGGLRFVIPPGDVSSGEPNVEVKIESFLTNPKKLFVELQMQWPRPASMAEFEPGALLQEADRFATTEVIRFIGGGEL